ncbi:MAG: hypothetical protein ABSF69_29985 [Polyangiaceae bacterium]|jgi:hypothetical protein
MIGLDSEAALEILDARDFYEARRVGLGLAFVIAANDTLDAIETAPAGFPAHPFAGTPGVKRGLFPPRWPYAFAFMILATGPFVLACEHLRRVPLYWEQRLRQP